MATTNQRCSACGGLLTECGTECLRCGAVVENPPKSITRLLEAYSHPFGIPLSMILSASIVLVCLGCHAAFQGIDRAILIHMMVLGFPLIHIWFSEPVAEFAGGSLRGSRIQVSHPLAVQVGGWFFLLVIAGFELYIYWSSL